MKKLFLLSVILFTCSALFAAPGDINSSESEFAEALPVVAANMAKTNKPFSYSKEVKGSLVIYKCVFPESVEYYTFEYGLQVCKEIIWKNESDILKVYQDTVKLAGRPTGRSGNNQIWEMFMYERTIIINVEEKRNVTMTNDYYSEYY